METRDNCMKHLFSILILLGFMSVASAEELILLHCNMESESGSRNISLEKNGKFLVTHEDIKHFRINETDIGLSIGALDGLPIWIFGETPGGDFQSIIIFNYKNLSYSATSAMYGDYDRAYENLDKNNYFCFPIEHPF